MSWRVLYIEESESISLYLDNIKVKRATVELTFPLNDICMIVIDNYKLTLTVGLANACSIRNIPIIMCGDNHHPLNILLPLSGHYNSSKVFLEQLNWKEDYKERFWKLYIKQKIKNQLFILKRNKPESTEAISLIENFISEVENFDKTNREGLAAKVYFRALFGPTFSRQNEDTINACLNYGYSIIRSLISKIIVAKGLNPQLGIFHKGAANYFNLSDDVIEVFRPIIDNIVYCNFINDKIFTREHRTKLLEIVNMKLEINNQKLTLNHSVEKVVDGIIGFFKNGNEEFLASFVPVLYDL